MKNYSVLVYVNALVALLAATARADNATVTIDATNRLARVPAIALGSNEAVWDGNLLDASLPGLLSDAGVRALRYPGGSTADVYHWQSNTTVPGQSYASPDNTFDAYMGVVTAAGARPIITVNYGAGTPDEAAGWVSYANRGGPRYGGPIPTYPGGSDTGHRYHVKYWEIGNELYGNGTYSADWEYDVNGQGPAVYATRLAAYSAAMKAADPSIKIGAVLTAPGNWPDGQTSSSSPQPWNDTILSAACSSIDFAVIHWYAQGPTGESDAALLASPENGEATSVSYTPSISAMLTTLRSELVQYCGPHASEIEIMVTESNSVSYNPGKQTTSLVNALFLADSVTTWLENGASNVDWWAVHNSITCDTNNSSALFGSYDFGDYGLLSSGETCSDAAEPPAETLFPSYYGFRMTSHFAEPDSTLLGTTSSTPLLSAHAVERRDGGVGVLLVNKDPAVSYDVTISLVGGSSCGSAEAEVHSYGIGSTSIARSELEVSGSSFALSAAPYSLTTVRTR
jgi:hypothetical protein